MNKHRRRGAKHRRELRARARRIVAQIDVQAQSDQRWDLDLSYIRNRVVGTLTLGDVRRIASGQLGRGQGE